MSIYGRQVLVLGKIRQCAVRKAEDGRETERKVKNLVLRTLEKLQKTLILKILNALMQWRSQGGGGGQRPQN